MLRIIRREASYSGAPDLPARATKGFRTEEARRAAGLRVRAIVGLESQVTGQELSTPVSEAPVRIRVLGNGDHDVARFDTAATLQFIAE